jgi:uncharacterized protein (TIGR02246 family)
MAHRGSLAIALCLGALAGCRAYGPLAGGGSTLSAEMRSAIADTVRSIGQATFNAGSARDLDRMYANFSPGTTLTVSGQIAPSWPAHQEQARAFYRTLRAVSYEPMVHGVDVLSPEVAIWRGRYRYTFTDSAGTVTSGTAAQTWVFVREDRRWRIVHAHISAPLPSR